MIGTLIVTLPSKFTGGELVVEHHDEQASFLGSHRTVVLCAFYVDCHHQVLPVKSGYRVALSYNLIASRSGKSALRRPDRRELDALEHGVREFFRTPPPPSWTGQPPQPPPDRLVVLLDHQYTQKGLDWRALKNADAARVGALRHVAEALDCEVALALADVHETWMCEDEEYGYGRYGRGRRRGYRRYVDEDENEEMSEESSGFPDLIELQDSEVELRHFVDAHGKAGAAAGRVPESELCFTKPSADLDPFQSQHEGYMGNWGNTVEHWYHRAAIVLWPRERTFLIRAKASAKYALDELSKALTQQEAGVSRKMAMQLAPFWAHVWHDAADSRLAEKTLKIALGLDDPELARRFVSPIGLFQLTAKRAKSVVSLAERYGLPWLEGLLGEWGSRVDLESDTARRAWLASFGALTRALIATESKQAPLVARTLVADQWKQLSKQHRGWPETRPSSTQSAIATFTKPLIALLDGAWVAGSGEVLTEIRQFLEPPNYPVLALAHLLETARGEDFAAELRDVEKHCAAELKRSLATPVRATDDWSIAFTPPCKCDLCKELSRFLAARKQITFEWPLAKDRRAHIHSTIEVHELPVAHETRRTGSPYTLVLQKTPELFAREAQDRNAWRRALNALTQKRASRPRRRTRIEWGQRG